MRFSVEAKRDHMYHFWSTYIGRPMVVVGPSLGGAAALDFALAHPEAVQQRPLAPVSPPAWSLELGAWSLELELDTLL